MPQNVDLSGFEPDNPNTSVSKTDPNYLPPSDTVKLINYYYDRTDRNTFLIALDDDDISAVQDQINPYMIKEVTVRGRTTHLIFKNKPIGIEYRIKPGANRDTLEDLDIPGLVSDIVSLLPIDVDVVFTHHKGAEECVTINFPYDESKNHNNHPTYFCYQSIVREMKNTNTLDITQLLAGTPLFQVMEDVVGTLTDVEMEHNEMMNGSLSYKTREAGLSRPW